MIHKDLRACLVLALVQMHRTHQHKQHQLQQTINNKHPQEEAVSMLPTISNLQQIMSAMYLQMTYQMALQSRAQQSVTSAQSCILLQQVKHRTQQTQRACLKEEHS